jgi:uncharacterized repeat protein (TIGR03803 family)
VLHRFTWGSDGASPLGDLTVLKGNLYGVTWTGGTQRVCEDLSNGCGTVFEISTSGEERIVYRFKGGKDGAFPEATLLAFNGKFYGTTSNGGKRNCVQSSCGTIFDVTTSGSEDVLYRFKSGSDGANPTAGLIRLGNILYGTTTGGGSGCSGYGCGTIFRVTASGQEMVLYRFKGVPDGAEPASRLTAVDGALYGSTPSGGKHCDGPSGYDTGTLFELTALATERVIQRFPCWRSQAGDGMVPVAPLLLVGQKLHGTTTSGGRYDGGTVFTLSYCRSL